MGLALRHFGHALRQAQDLRPWAEWLGSFGLGPEAMSFDVQYNRRYCDLYYTEYVVILRRMGF